MYLRQANNTMTHELERVTTAAISFEINKAAKVYAAQNGTSIRAIVDEAVSGWLRAHGVLSVQEIAS